MLSLKQVQGERRERKTLGSLTKAHSAGKIICPIHLEGSIFESSFLLPISGRISFPFKTCIRWLVVSKPIQLA